MEPEVLEKKTPFWLDQKKRSVICQIAACLFVGIIGWYLVSNATENLERQSIATGFGFLQKEASFEIGESVISYSAADTYRKALIIGAINTLKVAVIGVFFSIILGAFIGIARLSSNWLVSKLAFTYIEVMQNIPILLQLFFFYTLFYDLFPSPANALHPLSWLFISNRGLAVAAPLFHPSYKLVFTAFAAGVVIFYIIKKIADKRERRTGKIFRVFYLSIALIIGLPIVTWVLTGAYFKVDMPVLSGFNFKGGIVFSPEFAALVSGLILYTAAFIAEIVRAGIQSVGNGQKEAAASLGLKKSQTMGLVILPQALRVIIPPLTSQMLNLVKNSSLAIAIGFPDFVSVANTTINQTGQSIEGVALIMAFYLTFSLITSYFMNLYNKKMALKER
ncbi:MAG: ABC transporter permease subunit [Deltaproteobacteria bacterium]|nr:ABC transporter permease subunit [Deltaproteobacteria bacterium]